jgi:ABC-type amino acid transport system permease subunit
MSRKSHPKNARMLVPRRPNQTTTLTKNTAKMTMLKITSTTARETTTTTWAEGVVEMMAEVGLFPVASISIPINFL